MTVYGKSGKTMKLFSHSSHRPWKSLPRLPHSHSYDYYGHEYLPKTTTPEVGPDQTRKRGQIK
jgi:hypothetical protein